MNRDYVMAREYLQDGDRMEFEFEQNEKDFIVDEISHTKYTNSGNFLILHVKKVELNSISRRCPLPEWESRYFKRD